MTTTLHAAGLTTGAHLRESECRLDDFAALLEQQTAVEDYPHADRVERNVVIYRSERLRDAVRDETDRLAVEAELARALSAGTRHRRAWKVPSPISTWSTGPLPSSRT